MCIGISRSIALAKGLGGDITSQVLTVILHKNSHYHKSKSGRLQGGFEILHRRTMFK